VFINTEPLVLNASGGQDPTLDSYSTTGFVPGPITGWPGLTDDQRTELLYWLKEGSLPFDITYTFERPAMGTYDMVVMGTDTDAAALFPGLGCSPAIGLSDCDDANAENISFLFYGCMSAADQQDMHRVAFRIFAGLGFGWGLENLTGTGQIMANYSATGLEFGDVCTNISGASSCAHLGCPAGQQNSTQDLMARIGPRVDDGPPYVEITSPQDGTTVDPNITVDAVVGDLFGGLTVELEVVEAGQTAVDDFPPYGWGLEFPPGMWTLRVNATDADGNLASDEVMVCVDVPGCGGASSSDGTAADDTAGSTGGDEFTTDVFPEDTSSGGAPPSSTSDGGPTTSGPPPSATGFGGNEPETGCQCRATSSDREGPAPGVGVLLLLGALARRRPRPSRAGPAAVTRRG
ncbi:MAG: hypothetical protein KDK70_23335, partial [Myxococcales bacterium]|nr:hypothetical protein [Myxococcales bacterium]